MQLLSLATVLFLASSVFATQLHDQHAHGLLARRETVTLTETSTAFVPAGTQSAYIATEVFTKTIIADMNHVVYRKSTKHKGHRGAQFTNSKKVDSQKATGTRSKKPKHTGHRRSVEEAQEPAKRAGWFS